MAVVMACRMPAPIPHSGAARSGLPAIGVPAPCSADHTRAFSYTVSPAASTVSFATR